MVSIPFYPSLIKESIFDPNPESTFDWSTGDYSKVTFYRVSWDCFNFGEVTTPICKLKGNENKITHPWSRRETGGTLFPGLNTNYLISLSWLEFHRTYLLFYSLHDPATVIPFYFKRFTHLLPNSLCCGSPFLHFPPPSFFLYPTPFFFFFSVPSTIFVSPVR